MLVGDEFRHRLAGGILEGQLVALHGKTTDRWQERQEGRLLPHDTFRRVAGHARAGRRSDGQLAATHQVAGRLAVATRRAVHLAIAAEGHRQIAARQDQADAAYLGIGQRGDLPAGPGQRVLRRSLADVQRLLLGNPLAGWPCPLPTSVRDGS
jgi:hypothetical protein